MVVVAGHGHGHALHQQRLVQHMHVEGPVGGAPAGAALRQPHCGALPVHLLVQLNVEVGALHPPPELGVRGAVLHHGGGGAGGVRRVLVLLVLQRRRRWWWLLLLRRAVVLRYGPPVLGIERARGGGGATGAGGGAAVELVLRRLLHHLVLGLVRGPVAVGVGAAAVVRGVVAARLAAAAAAAAPGRLVLLARAGGRRRRRGSGRPVGRRRDVRRGDSGRRRRRHGLDLLLEPPRHGAAGRHGLDAQLLQHQDGGREVEARAAAAHAQRRCVVGARRHLGRVEGAQPDAALRLPELPDFGHPFAPVAHAHAAVHSPLPTPLLAAAAAAAGVAVGSPGRGAAPGAAAHSGVHGWMDAGTSLGIPLRFKILSASRLGRALLEQGDDDQVPRGMTTHSHKQ